VTGYCDSCEKQRVLHSIVFENPRACFLVCQDCVLTKKTEEKHD
jgi:hypothetical protein